MEGTCDNSNILVCSCCASAFSSTPHDTLEDPTISENKASNDSSTSSTIPCVPSTPVEFPEYQNGNETDWVNDDDNADVKWRSEATEDDKGSSNTSGPDDNQRNKDEFAAEGTPGLNGRRGQVGGVGLQAEFDPQIEKNVLPGTMTCAAGSVSETRDKENVCPSSAQINLPGFNKDRIQDILAILFEYPCILRKEKTLFSGDNENLIFCPKCEVALSRLYNSFRDFIELLKLEGQVGRILGRVGNEPEPLMPLLVYNTEGQNENSYGKSFGKTRRKLSRGLKQNEDNRQDREYKVKHRTVTKVRRKIRPLRRMTARQKKLCSPVETGSIEELEEHIANVTDGSEELSGSDNDKHETDEDFHPSCADDDYHIEDDSDDPTFIPRKSKSQADRKHELKRRDKKSQWSKQTTSSADYDGSDVDTATPVLKKKRIRNLKKEFWIDKAKQDPSRTCDICGKAFLYARMMQHHKSTVHEGKKPFECEYCGRGFTQNFILKKHTCDYSLAGGDKEFLRIAREEQLFKRPDHLKTHVKIVHSDEKRFVCTTCGQRFKTSSNLRAHERKHANPDQKHLCNICGKSIKTLSQMGRHQKTHEDVLPFECHICGKRFKMKDYLGQHLRKGKSCATKVSSSKPSQSDASASESQDFSSMIDFQPPEPQSSEMVLPVRDSVPSLPIEYHQYVVGATDTGILTNL
ncbi:unnamed protein product [Allacma fusca]|uniref:C2H2-type domain-containing protein n=1 Tax=Allacma fusca TaxID=39272 RepID=A0A8J2LW63_9HEXA|nr:unnamed protein product [Allacma fusca]